MTGTFGIGSIETTFSYLVEMLGEPKRYKRDGKKVDVEWNMNVPGTNGGVVATIYNYKTGKNYLGEKGKDPEDITHWHVGGNHPEFSLRYVKDKLGLI